MTEQASSSALRIIRSGGLEQSKASLDGENRRIGGKL